MPHDPDRRPDRRRRLTVRTARRGRAGQATRLSVAALLALTLLGPTVLGLTVLGESGQAFARPGRGGSIGSRGSHTYTPPPATAAAPFGAMPIGRTVTPPVAPRPAIGPQGAATPTRPARRGFATGFIAGLVGVGAAGLLAGRPSHHPMPIAGIAIEIAIVLALLAWLIVRVVRSRALPEQGPDGPIPRITRADRTRFERLLVDIQRAWTLSDMRTLTELATPEMVGIFNDQLRDLARRGARNSTSRVKLLQAELSETWHEHGSDYATVAMRYSLIDITTDGTGRIIEGDPVRPREIRELWTMRRQARLPWVLSAIQQA